MEIENMWLSEVIPFLITAIVTVFGVAFGTFLFRILWYIYGSLKLDKKAYVTKPILIALGTREEFHHYVKVAIRNNSKKTFRNCKPILVLKGEGRANYVSGKPYYEVETEGEICWGGLESSIKTIYPGEVDYVDLFRVVRQKDRKEDLQSTSLQMPSEKGWSRPRTLIIRKEGELKTDDKIMAELFLSLEWKGELKILSENGRPVVAKLAFNNMKKSLERDLMTKEFEILAP
jgi:hypothetical protein